MKNNYIALICAASVFAASSAVAGISVSVAASETDIWKGKQVDLTPTVIGQDGPVTYEWTVPDGVSIENPNAEVGKATFNKAGEMQCDLKVKDKCGESTGGATVNVYSVSFSPGSLEVGIGGIESLTATVKPEGMDGSVSFSSKDSAVASVGGNAPNLSVTGMAEGSTKVVASVGGVEGTVAPVAVVCKMVHKLLLIKCAQKAIYAGGWVTSPQMDMKVKFRHPPCFHSYGKFQNMSSCVMTIDYADGSQSQCIAPGRLRDMFQGNRQSPPPSDVIDMNGSLGHDPSDNSMYFVDTDTPTFPLFNNEIDKITSYSEECEFKFYFMTQKSGSPWKTELIGVFSYKNTLGRDSNNALVLDQQNTSSSPAHNATVLGTVDSELPILTGETAMNRVNFGWAVTKGDANSYAAVFLRR